MEAHRVRPVAFLHGRANCCPWALQKQNIKQFHHHHCSSRRCRRCHGGRRSGSHHPSLPSSGVVLVVVVSQGRRRQNAIKHAFHSWPLGAVAVAAAVGDTL